MAQPPIAIADALLHLLRKPDMPLQPFQLSPSRLETLIQLEETAACDVEAGFDWNHSTPDYLASAKSYINREKLLAVLREGLGNLLARADIEAIATELQHHTDDLVSAKLQTPPLP